MLCENYMGSGSEDPNADSTSPVAYDGFGGTFDSWRYHVSYRINDIFNRQSKHFNNPRIRSRLEKLMGSNVVRITDRKYMIKLQEKIKEDHLENQKKRIKEREAEEVEREKKLILEGKIPIDAAPKELKNHPLCKINQITKKILEDKKAKMKITSKILNYKTSVKKLRELEKAKQEESDKNGDEGSEIKDESEEVDDGQKEGSEGGEEEKPDEGEEVVEENPKGFIMAKDEYEKLKYEAPLVKKLKEVEGVEEMYRLAEEIVGPLKHQKTQA